MFNRIKLYPSKYIASLILVPGLSSLILIFWLDTGVALKAVLLMLGSVILGYTTLRYAALTLPNSLIEIRAHDRGFELQYRSGEKRVGTLASLKSFTSPWLSLLTFDIENTQKQISVPLSHLNVDEKNQYRKLKVFCKLNQDTSNQH